jgi:hypothetical protein
MHNPSSNKLNNLPSHKNLLANINPNNQVPYTMPNLDFTSEEQGESIRVCVRIRPMNMTEIGRGDAKCVEYTNSSTVLFKNKNIQRHYNYNISFGEGATQEDVFYSCSINVIFFNNFFRN